jgi:peroxiredoxin
MPTAQSFVLRIPDTEFVSREATLDMPGFDWVTKTSRDIFSGRRVVVFALPGAYTPTCSSTHLPGYEAVYEQIRDCGIDEVYCLSVNDSFVMTSWFKSLGVEQVKPLADGSGKFTRQMGMLVDKDNLGFGMRSWRYSMVVSDGIVERIWIEPGQSDNFEADPFTVSDSDTMLSWLQGLTP